MRAKGKPLSRASPHWVEYGTKPHQIKPKELTSNTSKKVRILGWKKGKYGEYFGTSVSHPGQHATHILQNTINDNIEEIRKAQEKYLREMDGELEKVGITHDFYEGVEEDD